MRAYAFGLCLAACGGVAAPAPPPTSPRSLPAPSEPDRVPIDPVAALAPDGERSELSWVMPGPIRFELGGAAVAAGGSDRPIEVAPIDREGNLVRVAVQLEHARFSVWIQRAHMLSVMTRDYRIDSAGAGPDGEIQAVLRAGAVVRRLAHRDRATRVRYLGALQVEGWVPDAVLSDRGAPRAGAGRVPTGRRTLMVVPGAVIRAEPRGSASELAIMASGYFLDAIGELDDAWTEVGYEDGDVAVHGFVSRRDPPGRVYRWHDGEVSAAVAPSATVASGTCLYARAGGEPIGYMVGNRPVELDDTGGGWWNLAIDTPWGPLGFAARGPSKSELVVCAPPGSVPPATP